MFSYTGYLYQSITVQIKNAGYYIDSYNQDFLISVLLRTDMVSSDFQTVVNSIITQLPNITSVVQFQLDLQSTSAIFDDAKTRYFNFINNQGTHTPTFISAASAIVSALHDIETTVKTSASASRDTCVYLSTNDISTVINTQIVKLYECSYNQYAFLTGWYPRVRELMNTYQTKFDTYLTSPMRQCRKTTPNNLENCLKAIKDNPEIRRFHLIKNLRF